MFPKSGTEFQNKKNFFSESCKTEQITNSQCWNNMLNNRTNNRISKILNKPPGRTLFLFGFALLFNSIPLIDRW